MQNVLCSEIPCFRRTLFRVQGVTFGGLPGFWCVGSNPTHPTPGCCSSSPDLEPRTLHVFFKVMKWGVLQVMLRWGGFAPESAPALVDPCRLGESRLLALGV